MKRLEQDPEDREQFVEFEPAIPQFVSGIARCEVINEIVHMTFYIDRPRVIDGKIITEKALSAWIAVPLKAYLASHIITQAAINGNKVELSAEIPTYN